MDRITVSYAPGIRAFGIARQAAPRRTGTVSVLAVGQPLPTFLAPLKTEAEIQVVRGLPRLRFEVHDIEGPQATRRALLDALERFDVLHFAGHAKAFPATPLDSALSTANDEPLAVRDLLTRDTSRTRFAVLSACSTAEAGTALPEEMISLPTALLGCGLTGVIGTLWTTFDRPALEVMKVFYREWGQGTPAAQALRTAQSWTREQRGFASVLAWGGFVHVGP